MNTSRPGDLPRYSVVVPCYNERDNIVDLAQEIGQVMDGVGNYELLIVDDCSTDGSKKALLHAIGEDGLGCRLLVHAANYGQSAAICTGIEHARGEWIITLDGDGQNDPADIPALLEALQSHGGEDGIPLVCGYRKKRKDKWLRRISSRVANRVRSAMLGDATPDTGCGLKLIHRASYLKLPRFNHMHRFLPALIRRDGGVVISVEVNHRPRIHGISKYGLRNRLWVGIVDLFGVMWLKRRKFRGHTAEELT